MRRIILTALIGLALTPAAAMAGPYPGEVGTCTFDPATNVIHATGLPYILEHPVYGNDLAVINFRREDSAGSVLDEYVLGYAPSGEMDVAVSAPVGVEGYEFISQTWGNDGSQYSTYARCTS